MVSARASSVGQWLFWLLIFALVVYLVVAVNVYWYSRQYDLELSSNSVPTPTPVNQCLVVGSTGVTGASGSTGLNYVLSVPTGFTPGSGGTGPLVKHSNHGILSTDLYSPGSNGSFTVQRNGSYHVQISATVNVSGTATSGTAANVALTLATLTTTGSTTTIVPVLESPQKLTASYAQPPSGTGYVLAGVVNLSGYVYLTANTPYQLLLLSPTAPAASPNAVYLSVSYFTMSVWQ